MKKFGLLFGLLISASVFMPRNINYAQGEEGTDYRWLLRSRKVSDLFHEGLQNASPEDQAQIQKLLPKIESMLQEADRRIELPPAGKFLSGGALSYLMARYDGSSPGQPARTASFTAASTEPDFIQPDGNIFLAGAFPLQFRVNNPAQDQIRKNQTTQSETAIAVSGRNVVIGWNDTGQFQPAIAGPGGNLNVGVRDAARSFTGYGFSRDGGATFTDGGAILPLQPRGFSLSSGDPAIAADRRGNFYFAALGSTASSDAAVAAGGASIIGVSKSTDGGRTFGRPVIASAGFGLSFPAASDFHDKELITVDNTGGPNDSNVYVSWTDFIGAPGVVKMAPGPIIYIVSPNAQIRFARSTNQGATFSRFGPVSPLGETIVTVNIPQGRIQAEMDFPQGSVPAVGPNGEVYVAWEQVFSETDVLIGPGRAVPAAGNQTRTIRIAKSTDAGKTFGAIDRVGQVQVTRLNPVPFFDASAPVGPGCSCAASTFFGAWRARGGGIRSQEFPTLAVDTTTGPNRGNVYLAWNEVDGTGVNGTDIFFSRSTDGGLTWSKKKLINRSGEQPTHDGDQFEPAMVVAPNGTIGIIYYNREFDPQNELMGLSLATSMNGGVFWTTQLVSNTLFPPPLTAVAGLVRPAGGGFATACGNFDPAVALCYMGEYNGIAADANSFYISWGDNRSRIGARADPDVFFTKVPVP